MLNQIVAEPSAVARSCGATRSANGVGGSDGGRAGEMSAPRWARVAEESGLQVADLAVGDRVGDDIALNGNDDAAGLSRICLAANRVRVTTGRCVGSASSARCRLVPADRGWISGANLNGSAVDVHRRCGNRRCGLTVRCQLLEQLNVKTLLVLLPVVAITRFSDAHSGRRWTPIHEIPSDAPISEILDPADRGLTGAMRRPASS